MSQHLSWFLEIDSLLSATKKYWQCIAFNQREIPWPELLSSLHALSDKQLEVIEHDQNKIYDFLSPFITELASARKLTIVESKDAKNLSFPFWLTNGIKGNKLKQLESFVAHLSDETLPLLEWCAGKGHLGRMHAACNQTPVQSIEIRDDLVELGAELAKQHRLDIDFYKVDALSSEAEKYVKTDQHAVALHACGGLHQSLMRHAVAKNTHTVSISPCCYHLFQPSANYTAMSHAGKASNVYFSDSDLKLALQETVTSGQRVARLRDIETHWRLAFDCLLDDVLNKTTYLPIPSAKKALFSGEFSDFCLWAAKQKNILLPDNINYAYYLELGAKRKAITKRVELVRHGFRRLIELWLVLDRALFLQDNGYKVSLYTFCDKQVTPRNILIQAHKI